MGDDVLGAIASIKTPIICTCVNGGYIASGLVENWVRSLIRCGLGAHVLIVALDDEAAEAVATLPVRCLRWNAEDLDPPSRQSLAYRTEGWKQIVFSKVMFVRLLLATDRDVLFSDSDVVFLQNPLPHLCGLPRTDFLFQSDAAASDQSLDPHVLCSGLYFARPTARAIEALRCDRKICEPWKGDQDFFRARLADQKIATCAILDRELFPNGALWKKKPPSRPIAVHFNWTIGARTKAAEMRAAGLWLLPE
jgi:hypothetical protein